MNGTIDWTYDDAARTMIETGPLATVTSTFDLAGRRTALAISGEATITYEYDSANHLTTLTQGSNTVSLTYDAAGRRSSVTYPNGIVATYQYDAGSRITQLTYSQGVITLGTLTYTYDALGRPSEIGGGWARVALPAAMSSAAYDIGDRITQWNGASVAYDANGQTASNSAASFDWDGWGRLVGINGPSSTSFEYDALGRRVALTRGGVTTRFVYDGWQVVQERAGDGSIAASELPIDLDDVAMRTDSTGARTLLTDALGSTLALADETGALSQVYTYEPFGRSITTGGPGAPLQFNGRENDNTGLYYYRARYYDPTAGRFLSEDPIGFAAGANFYTYALDSPLRFVDPFGLDILVIENGPIGSGNFIGHTAIGITGKGMFSYGNGTKQGSSIEDYLNREAGRRNTDVYVLKTTREQDEAAYKAVVPDVGLGKLKDNCASRSNHILDAAGIPYPTCSWWCDEPDTATTNVPGYAGRRALAAGADHFAIPKGSAIPPALLKVIR